MFTCHHHHVGRRPVPSTPFRFQRLPAELRNRVYKFALVAPGPLRPDSAHNYARHGWQMGLGHLHLPTTLLRTNKAIHEEAAAVLYGQNSFTFDDVNPCCHGCCGDSEFEEMEGGHSECERTDFKLFLLDIGLRNRLRLRHIIFSFHRNYAPSYFGRKGRFIADALHILSQGHALRVLEINLSGEAHLGDMGTPNGILSEMRKIKGLAELRITSSDEEASNLLKQEIESKIGDMEDSSEEECAAHQEDRDLVRHLASLVNERGKLEEKNKEERRERMIRLRRIEQIDKLFEGVKKAPTEITKTPDEVKKSKSLKRGLRK